MMPVVLRSAVLVLSATGISLSAPVDDHPQRRPGLWEVTRTAVDATNPARTTQVCIDQATEAALRAIGDGFARTNCSSTDTHVSQRELTADAVCQLGNSRSTSHTVVTFTGDTEYHQVSTTQVDPPQFGRSEVTSETAGKWIGPCDADMRPGDMITVMGKINLVDRIAQQK
jgi:Protein of unknown function (DUF3617)